METLRASTCLTCGAGAQQFRWGVLSSFLSERAFGAKPKPVKIYECSECGLRWSERGLSEEEGMKLYSGYRGDQYFTQRHSYEPWYSRELNDGIGSEVEMVARRKILLEALEQAQFNPNASFSVADHGGDRGQMLLGFPNAIKKVFDLSGVELEPGCERIERIKDEVGRNDLVLTCHVLEHLTDPKAGLLEAASLAKPKGLVFVELPDEQFKGAWQPPFQRWLLHWLIGKQKILLLTDFLNTGMRAKLRWIPPLGFVVVREHLQYFTIRSIEKLMTECGLEVLLCRNAGTNFVALGRKR